MLNQFIRIIAARDYSRVSIDAICFSALGLSLCLLRTSLLAGGEKWNQGDWLINNEQTFVRRGMLGSLLIRMGDALSLSPIATTIGVQAGLLILSYLIVWYLCRVLVPTRLGLLLISSSAFFILFFPAVPSDGVFRKELITFASILLEIYALAKARHSALIASACLFAVSVFAHEALILFTALYILILFYVINPDIGPPTRLLIGCFAIVSSVIAAIIAVRYSQIPDPSVVCKPLLDRGVQMNFCDGAIVWLNRPFGAFFDDGLNRAQFMKFLISYAIALIPYFYVLKISHARRTVHFFFFMSVLPILPLYVLAIDWGRWLAYHVFSVFCISICAYHRGDLNFPSRSDGRHIALITSLALCLAPFHVVGLFPGGFLRRMIEVAYDHLRL